MPAGVARKKVYNVQKVWGKQDEILRLFSVGVKPKEIAAELDITPQTVHNICGSPLGRARIAALQGARDLEFQEVSARIKALQPVALEVAEDFMLGKLGPSEPKDRTRAAFELLKMGGHGPVHKVAKSVRHGLSEADRKRIAEVSNQLRLNKVPQLEEANFEEVESE